jgi:4'-phosphopantetheinyl transferase
VHVWRAGLNPTAQQVESLQLTLAPEELERSARFYLERDRQHFIVARGILRTILGNYLDTEPSQLHFEYTGYGKPFLTLHPGQPELCFNLSHSDDLALYAVTCQRRIGIDLERVRLEVDHDQIAARFFSPWERDMIHSLPVEARPLAFFSVWTRKEAYLKAHGAGLWLPLDRIIVSVAPGEPAYLVRTDDDPRKAAQWSLLELCPGPGYVATLAVEGLGWALACYAWQR